MCIIAYCETRRLTKEEFTNCWNSNSDGFGMAWREKGVIKYSKGYEKMKKAWKFYQKIDTLPHTAHFRITSVGDTVPELTHPFVVRKDSPLKMEYSGKHSVLFHNGTISDWERFGMSHFASIGKIPKGKMSDSRVAAMLVSSLGDRALEFMSGKFVLFNEDDAYLYGDFDEAKGIFFSNSGYKSYSKRYSYSNSRYYGSDNLDGFYDTSLSSKARNTSNKEKQDLWERHKNDWILFNNDGEEVKDIKETVFVTNSAGECLTVDEWYEQCLFEEEFETDDPIVEDSLVEDAIEILDKVEHTTMTAMSDVQKTNYIQDMVDSAIKDGWEFYNEAGEMVFEFDDAAIVKRNEVEVDAGMWLWQYITKRVNEKSAAMKQEFDDKVIEEIESPDKLPPPTTRQLTFTYERCMCAVPRPYHYIGMGEDIILCSECGCQIPRN